jgi:hypothetical protein
MAAGFIGMSSVPIFLGFQFADGPAYHPEGAAPNLLLLGRGCPVTFPDTAAFDCYHFQFPGTLALLGFEECA